MRVSTVSVVDDGGGEGGWNRFEGVRNNTKHRFGFSVCVVAYNRDVDEFRMSLLVDESGDTRTVMYCVSFNTQIF